MRVPSSERFLSSVGDRLTQPLQASRAGVDRVHPAQRRVLSGQQSELARDSNLLGWQHKTGVLKRHVIPPKMIAFSN